MGYATVYTMAPVFSLVLDRDVSEELALLYPELYKELTKVGTPSLRLQLTSRGGPLATRLSLRGSPSVSTKVRKESVLGRKD